MIIVEGPDGAGKSTLIQTLVKDLGLPIAPRVVSKDAEVLVDLSQWVDENLNRGFQKTIFDRHRLISEPIYGPVLRKQQQPGFTDRHRMSDWMFRFYNLEPILIYCLPPIEVVKKNIEGDVENRVVWDHIEGIYAGYVARASIDFRLAKHVFMYDYTMETMSNHNLTSIKDTIANA